MIDRGPVQLNGLVRTLIGRAARKAVWNRPCRIARRPGVRSAASVCRVPDGPSGGSRHTTGFLPDSYRHPKCHYCVSLRFPAIAGETVQKGAGTLEFPLETVFSAAF
jgi:hypothetical protein